MLNFGLLKSQAQKDADEEARNILIARIEAEAKAKESSNTSSDKTAQKTRRVTWEIQ